MRKKLSEKLLLDRAVVTSLCGQVFRLLTGPATLYLVFRYLDLAEQGYYYTFQSVLGLSILLELGFAQNIVQFTAHEASKLSSAGSGPVKGDMVAQSRVASLARLSIKYYGWAAVMFGVFVGGGGIFFFRDSGLASAAWVGPWIWIVVSSGLSLALTPFWALLEGFNKYAEVALFRIYWSIIVFGVLTVGLVGGLKLWAMALSGIAGSVFSAVFLWKRWGVMLRSLTGFPVTESIAWRREIWPFQWRIGLSWLSGYFIFSYVVPVIFKLVGSVEAGRFGFTLQLVKLVSALSLTWVNTKTASLSMLIADKNWRDLDRVWGGVTRIAMLLVVIGMIPILLGSLLLPKWWPALGVRMASPAVTSLLICSSILSTLTACLAGLLRAHKKEPYVWISSFAAVLAAVLCPWLAIQAGVTGAATGYMLATLVVFPFAVRIFYVCRHNYRSQMGCPISR